MYVVTAAAASHLVVHVLRERDHRLADVFGELTGDEVDKFALVDWNDRRGYLLEPQRVVRARPNDDQLGLQDAEHLEPGHPA